MLGYSLLESRDQHDSYNDVFQRSKESVQYIGSKFSQYLFVLSFKKLFKKEG